MKTITEQGYKLMFFIGLGRGTAKEANEYTDKNSIDLMIGAYSRAQSLHRPILSERITVDGKTYDTTRAYQDAFDRSWPLDGIRFAKEVA